MPSDFFTELGKSVAAELGRPSGRYPANPSVRQELANIMGITLDNHLARPPMTAKDQAMRRPNPRHAYDQLFEQTSQGSEYNQGDQGPISASDCIAFVKLCAQRLAGGEREEFLTALADLLSTEEPSQDTNFTGNGVRANNPGALDRRRNGARDNRNPGAMDSAIRGMNTASFLRKWPDAAKVSLSSTGR